MATRFGERRAVLRAAAVAVNALDGAIRECVPGSPEVELAHSAAQVAVAAAEAEGWSTADIGVAARRAGGR